MARVDDRVIGIARVYSRAILKLAEAQGIADQLLDELGQLRDHLDRDPDFAAFVSRPTIDEDDRGRSLERIFRSRTSDLLVDSLQVMNRKGRLELLAAVADAYRHEYQERRGCIDVRVTTAVPLSPALRDELTTAVAAWCGRRPELVEEVDDGMIGGVVLRIGDEKLDATVRYEIRRLRAILHDRAVHEIHGARRYVVDG